MAPARAQEPLTDPVALTARLVRIAGITPARGESLKLPAAWLESLGFSVRELAFGEGEARVENLYARRGAGAPHLCFLGHLDVVPPGDEADWTHPPFAAHQADGMLFGRGAVDMKGGIGAFLAAVARATPPADGSLSLLLTGDEEGEARFGTRAVAAQLEAEGETKTWDACLVGEPTSRARLGDTFKVGRRGSLHAALTVRGIQGHVAYPHLADNPIHRLAAFLEAAVREPLDAGTDAFEPSSLQITRIAADSPANVIPATAEARFNVRYNDHHTAESLEAHFRRLLTRFAPDHSCEFHSSGDAFLSPPGSFAALVAESIEAECGIRAEASTGGGTSDARFVWQYAPVVEFGLVGKTMHQVDERVALADLETLTAVYTAVLRRFFA